MRIGEILPIAILILGLEIAAAQNFTVEDKYEIMDVQSSSKYVCLNLLDTESKKSYLKTIKVYNIESSELVYQFDEKNEFIVFAFVTDNKLIYVTNAYDEFDDDLAAIDLATGNQIWSMRNYRSNYELSPDGKHLLTSYQDITASGSKFSIINCDYGTIAYESEIGDSYYATWYTNEKILFALNRSHRELNPEYLLLEKKREERRNLRSEHLELRYKYRNNIIDFPEYDSKKSDIEKKSRSSMKQLVKCKQEKSEQTLPRVLRRLSQAVGHGIR
jgi:hypothetical protein